MRIPLLILSLLLIFSLSLFSQKAPDFKLITTDQAQISLYADYLNQGKSVVLELFFVSCPPCNNLAPYMADLHTELKDEDVAVEFISLSDKNWDNTEGVDGFKTKYMHDWPFVSPEGGSLDAVEIYEDGTYGAFWGTPTTIVISPDGTVNYNVRGAIGTDWTDNLKAAIIESQTAFNEVDPIIRPMATVTGGIKRSDNEGVGGVNIIFSGAKDTTILTNADGTFSTGSLLADTSYTVSLSKTTGAGIGVTTFDIITISKHILGIQPFSESYQSIAADVNQSGSATTFDMVQIRRLILGIITEFPDAPSWVFEPSEMELDSLQGLDALSFTGIKIADLNNSGDPSNLLKLEDRNTTGTFSMHVKDRFVKKGEIFNVNFLSNDLEATVGFQFTLDFDINYLQLIDLEKIGINKMNEDNFNFNNKGNGLLSTSWNNLTPQKGNHLFTLSFKADKEGYLSDMLVVNSKLTVAEAYSPKNELLEVGLIFEKEAGSTSEKAMIYPNPIGNESMNLSFSLTKSEPVQIKIMDLSGKAISQYHYNFQEGQQQIKLSTSNLDAGIYFVRILQKNELLEVLKFVKE